MVITTNMPELASALQLKEDGKCIFLFPQELKILCWLSHNVVGDVLEIGCNVGLTTAQLAIYNPNKLIHAVDFSRSRVTMCPQQMREKPRSGEDVCRFGRGLPNVRVYDINSHLLDYDMITSYEQGKRPLGLIFIDGDHSFSGVKSDTKRAMNYFAHHDGIIVWHDYCLKSPSWVKVTEFIDCEIAPKHGIVHIAQTRLVLWASGSKSQGVLMRLIQPSKKRLLLPINSKNRIGNSSTKQ